jgi:hypothetical protein
MFAKPNTLIYLQRSSLMLAGHHIGAARLDLPEDTVKNLAIVDKTKLLTLCEQFFADHQLDRRRIIVVLDGSVVFQKVVELDKTGQPDLLMQAFVDAMPFEPGDRACLAIEEQTSLRLFATSAKLYLAIVDALHIANVGHVMAITPAAAYELDSNNRSISAAAEHFFADSHVRKLADFRTVVPV